MMKEVANEPSVGLYFVQQHVHKAVPGLLALKVWALSCHSFRLELENSFKYLSNLEDHQTMKMRVSSYVGCYTPLLVSFLIEVIFLCGLLILQKQMLCLLYDYARYDF
jgi:hypothetical protein